MRLMCRFPVLTVLLLSLLLVPAAGAQQETDLAAELDRLFARAYPPDQPGAAVLVVRDGETLLRRAYGMADLELGVPLEPDMVFRLGSITKQFTAVAILMLAQEGKLAVTDAVTVHLPDSPSHWQPITIEHLLTHTSGIPNVTDQAEWMEIVRNDLSLDELIALFRDLPLEFEPGSRFRYSNSGYLLLGAIIEGRSGMSYANFVAERIFRPLGMDHSHYGSNRRLIPRRARGYQRDGDAYVNAPYLSMTQPHAAGALLSSVDDLARWDAALYTDRLLPAAARRKLWRPYRLANGEESGYGYGWVTADHAGHRVISHGGGIFGFATAGIRLPDERIYIAVLSNNPDHRPDPNFLAQQVASALYGESYEPQAIAVDPAILEKYAGVYRITDNETRVVTVADGQLFTQRGEGRKRAAFPLSEDTFFYENSLSRIRFVTGDDGEVGHMILLPWAGEEERAERTDEPLPQAPAIVRVDPALYDDYAGRYEILPGFVLTVWRDGDRLLARGTGEEQAVELFPTGEAVFFNPDHGLRIAFERDTHGVVTALTAEQGGEPRRCRRLD